MRGLARHKRVGVVPPSGSGADNGAGELDIEAAPASGSPDENRSASDGNGAERRTSPRRAPTLEENIEGGSLHGRSRDEEEKRDYAVFQEQNAAHTRAYHEAQHARNQQARGRARQHDSFMPHRGGTPVKYEPDFCDSDNRRRTKGLGEPESNRERAYSDGPGGSPNVSHGRSARGRHGTHRSPSPPARESLRPRRDGSLPAAEATVRAMNLPRPSPRNTPPTRSLTREQHRRDSGPASRLRRGEEDVEAARRQLAEEEAERDRIATQRGIEQERMAKMLEERKRQQAALSAEAERAMQEEKAKLDEQIQHARQQAKEEREAIERQQLLHMQQLEQQRQLDNEMLAAKAAADERVKLVAGNMESQRRAAEEQRQERLKEHSEAQKRVEQQQQALNDARRQGELELQNLELEKNAANVQAIVRSPSNSERFLLEGGYLWKIPFNSNSLPRKRWFQLARDPVSRAWRFQWQDPKSSKKGARCVPLADVTELREGQNTAAFARCAKARQGQLPDATLCFSLISHDRTVDLAAMDGNDAQTWIGALKSFIAGGCRGSDSMGARSADHAAPPVPHLQATPLTPQLHEPIAPREPHCSTATASATESSAPSAPTSCLPPRGATESERAYWLRTLFPAARENKLKEVSQLYAADCPVDLMEPQTGETPLLIGCRQGFAKMVELCLSWGAKNDPHPQFGQTALQAAVGAGHPTCTKLLLATAALSAMDHAIVNHEDHSASRSAPLHIAAAQGSVELCTVLLEHGADPVLVDSNGRTALHRACAGGHKDVVGLLIDVDDSVLERGDHRGCTPLLIAADSAPSRKAMAVVQMLLESAANPVAINEDGMTASQLAEKGGREECARLLRKYELEASAEGRGVAAYTRCLKPGEDSGPGTPLQPEAASPLPRPSMRRTNSMGATTMSGAAASAWGTSQPPMSATKAGSKPLFQGLELAAVSSPEPKLNSSPLVRPASASHAGALRRTMSLGASQMSMASPYFGSNTQEQASCGPATARPSTAIGARNTIRNQLRQQAAHRQAQHAQYGQQHQYQQQYYDHEQQQQQQYLTLSPQSHWGQRKQPARAAWGQEESRASSSSYPDGGFNAHSAYAPQSEIGYSSNADYYQEGQQLSDGAGQQNFYNGTSHNQQYYTDAAAAHSPSAPASQNAAGYASPHVSDIRSQQHWEVMYTEEGYEYYYNNVTGESQWEDPRGQATPLTKAAEQPSVSQSPYARAWGSVSDDKSTTPDVKSMLQAKAVEEQAGTSAEIMPAADDKVNAGSPQHTDASDIFAAKAGPGDADAKVCVQVDTAGAEAKESSNPLEQMLAARAGAKPTKLERKEVEEKKEAPNPLAQMLAARSKVSCTPAEHKDASDFHLQEPETPTPKPTLEPTVDADAVRAEWLARAEAAKSNPELKQYFRMKMVGLPVGAIVQKMVMKGLSTELVQQFEAASSDGPPQSISAPVTRQKPATAAGPPVHLLPEFKKYAKMKSIGVPLGSIKQKMAKDGVEDERIAAFAASISGDGEAGGRAPPRGPPPGGAAATFRAAQARRNSKPMMKLHWNKLDDERVKNSIWSKEAESTNIDLGSDERAVIDDLFSADAPTSKPLPTRKKSVDNEVKLIDGRRANNVGISLAQFKSFESYDALATAVVRMDDSKLSLEKLQNLQLLLPTAQEMKQLRSYSGPCENLGQCERFFMAVSKVPRLQNRLGVFIFRQQLPDACSSLKSKIRVVCEACEQIVTCDKLVQVLQKVLAVGNAMNEGTFKGAATGFTLDSLLKVMMTKGKDKVTTVLDAVARMLGSQGKGELFDFPSELSSIAEASRIQKAQLVGELTFISASKRRVETERDALRKEGDAGQSPGTLQMVEKLAEDAMSQIQLLKEGMARVDQKSSQLAAYFGEPADTPPEKVFDVMLQFTRACNRAHEKFCRMQKRQQQQS